MGKNMNFFTHNIFINDKLVIVNRSHIRTKNWSANTLYQISQEDLAYSIF